MDLRTLMCGTVLGVSLALMASPVLADSGGSSATVPTSGDAALEADYSKAEYLIKSEKFEEAIPYLQKVVAKKADHADALNYLGYTHRKLGKNVEALGFYQKALAVDPKHLGAHEYLGELHLQMKELGKAEGEMATLKGLCPAGCEQAEDLEDAIAQYKTANPG
jgi:tetratricopeptide (TPR) repeat protein